MTQIRNLKTGIKYKDTPIGKIPVDWEAQRLGDLCISQPEYGANVSAIDKDNNLPRHIRITDVSEGGRLLTSTWKSIKKEVAQPYMLQEGDFLFARSGATVGKAYLYKKKDGECAFAGYMIRFKPNPHQLLPEFLFQYAHSNYYYNWVKGILRSGAQPNIKAQEYSDMLIPKPPLDEQKRIAEILTTLDDTIEKTAQIIEKTKDAKKGLMKRLLIHGINHKKFKKTEIGEIPEEWSLLTLEEIVPKAKGSIKRGPFWGTVKKEVFVSEGYKVYEQKNVIYNDFQLGDYYIDEMKFRELEDFQIKPNDLLISCSGTIGKIAMVPTNAKKGIMNQALLRITLDQEKIIPEFFKQLFESSEMQEKVISHMHGSAMKNIVSVSELKRIPFVIPPIKEQNKIVELINGVDFKIRSDETYKSELTEIKKGLMQVLLTGKIRVKV